MKTTRKWGLKVQEKSTPEKTTFKKQLAEIKWFIRGKIDILKIGMEELLQTQWMLRNMKKITLKMKKKQKRENSLIYKVDGSYDYRN